MSLRVRCILKCVNLTKGNCDLRITPGHHIRHFSSSSIILSNGEGSSRVRSKLLPGGPDLKYFITAAKNGQSKIIPSVTESDTYLSKEDYSGENRKVKFITYGCQMNVNDMETVRSILFANKYLEVDDERKADVVLLMTCSIREGAEEKVWRVLKKLRRSANKQQTVGVLVKFITYGCQMNVNDMETVRSILFANKYLEVDDERKADVVLLMTCSIREGAEEKVWRVLKKLRRSANKQQTVGVLGCMAERVRHKLLQEANAVDVVAGPDSYRDLPRLLAVTRTGRSAINVQLSLEETYADVTPVRLDPMAKSAFVSIMRGCDNMCTYCIVPFTRGRERSRPLRSIVDEGYKQVVLLGQNVNSYRDTSEATYVSCGIDDSGLAPGFKTVYKPKKGGLNFATLLERVSDVDPEMRIRFTSPHPKDFSFQVIELIKERTNICKQIHLPAQSGSNTVLEAMGRGYTRESYLALVDQIRQLIPEVSLTSDFIAGFCGETERDHQQTLDLIRRVRYSFCYVFPYSMREKTRASYHLKDDVPIEVKRRRHEELAQVFRGEALKTNAALVGSKQLVLIESRSKRSATAVAGRADGGAKVILENCEVDGCGEVRELRPGDYVAVESDFHPAYAIAVCKLGVEGENDRLCRLDLNKNGG
uniref:CDK5RAP1-like protein n=1 Tax=Ascaris lumbricoides TaxID=6252 RepID=A0A9J2P9J3_ASCLU